MFISRSALRAVAAPLRAQRHVPALRYLRTTSGPTPPPSAASQTPNPASPDPSQPTAEPPRETQTGKTPSGESLPPLSAGKPVETPSAPGGSSPDPTPSSAAASPAFQVPPVDALSTRQNSIAEAFLDLHPDVAPRSEEEMRGNQFPGEKTGAKARGAGKSSIEKKRANLARAAGVMTVAGLVWAVYDLGKDWADEEEQKKMFARSDDKQAIEEAQEGGWLGWWGRLKIRAADHLDVRPSSLVP